MRSPSKALFGSGAIALIAMLSLTAGAADLRLAQAIKRGDRKEVVRLLKQHVEVNAKLPDGATALHWAVYQNDLETSELLIRAGADVNAMNEYGVRPLQLASTNRNAALVVSLLKAGADANALN